MSEKISVGIAGLGRSGYGIHTRTLHDMTDRYTIAGVFDADATRARDVASELGGIAYSSIEELLTSPGVELVVVATPNAFHEEHAAAALAAGKHVVCEKPMATDLSGAERLAETVRMSDQVFAVFQNRRFQPDFMKVKEVVDSGVLGDIRLVNIRWNDFSMRWDWQTLKKNGGGNLNNTGPHVLDHALQLFGDGEPDEVFADLGCMLTSGDAEDHVKIVIKGTGRPVVDIEISSGVVFGGDRWTVSGTRGGLRGSVNELWWKSIDPGFTPPAVEDTPTPDRSYNRLPLEFTEEHWEKPADLPSPATQFYGRLAEAIRDGAEFPVTIEEVMQQMRLISRAKEQSPV